MSTLFILNIIALIFLVIRLFLAFQEGKEVVRKNYNKALKIGVDMGNPSEMLAFMQIPGVKESIVKMKNSYRNVKLAFIGFGLLNIIAWSLADKDANDYERKDFFLFDGNDIDYYDLSDFLVFIIVPLVIFICIKNFTTLLNPTEFKD